MTPDEAIAKLKTLPEDKQREVLSRLSPDERKGILGKLSSKQPGEIRSLTQRERFMNPNLYPVGAPREGVWEDVKNLAQRAGVGVFQLANAAANPRQTVAGILSSVLPEPVVSGVNKAVDEINKIPGAHYLTTKLPENTENPIQQMYEMVEPGGLQAAANLAPIAGQAIAGGAFGPAAESITQDIRNVPEAAGGVARSLGGAGTKTVTDLVESTRKANEAADKAHLAEAQKGVEKQRGARLNSLKTGREAERQRQTAEQEVRNANEHAVKAQEDRAMTEKKLVDSTKELQAQIETAREKALKVGNEKYNAVNEKLSDIPADGRAVAQVILEATDKIRGSEFRGAEAHPRILQDMEERIKAGKGFTYNDLQGYYSELNKELSKGTLPGDVYASYDTLHEAIGNEMQQIANSQGLGGQLNDARTYWRRMKQAFGKPYNPSDVATGVLEKVSPDVTRAAEEENRLRLLGSFDKSIPQTAEHITNLRKGLSELPKPAPLRSILKQLPSAAEKPRVPKMQEAPVPERPVPEKIGAKEIQAVKLKSLEKRAQAIRGAGFRWGLAWPAFEAVRSVLRGSMPGVEGLGAGFLAGYAGSQMVARLLEKPGVADFLTKATPADVAAIPADLRGDVSAVAQAAAKKGIAVSPALTAGLGLTSAAGQVRKRVAAALTAQ